MRSQTGVWEQATIWELETTKHKPQVGYLNTRHAAVSSRISFRKYVPFAEKTQLPNE